MNFITATDRLGSWDLFFQCPKCGEIKVISKEEFTDVDNEYNEELK